jgi:hypothetical protein
MLFYGVNAVMFEYGIILFLVGEALYSVSMISPLQNQTVMLQVTLMKTKMKYEMMHKLSRWLHLAKVQFSEL